MVSKVQERIYAESAIKLLQIDWQLAEIPEPLDFEVHSSGLASGLEIRQVFADPEQSFGSPAKREESGHARVVNAVAKHYYALGGLPISVKFLGAVSSVEIEPFAQELRASAPSYPGERKIANIQGVKVFMNPLSFDQGSYSRWIYVDDRVGWVRSPTNAELQKAVDRKQANLSLYKQKYECIDLILVADRTFNSGKLQGNDNLVVCNPGFRAIYFLSYPESIQRVG